MTTLELLRDARRRIATPDRWIKGTMYSEDFFGARKYCLHGAVSTRCDNEQGNVGAALAEISKTTGWWSITIFNDFPFRTHQEVLEVLDKTISRLEAA